MSDPDPAPPLPSIWKHLCWAVFRIQDILLGQGCGSAFISYNPDTVPVPKIEEKNYSLHNSKNRNFFTSGTGTVTELKSRNRNRT